MKRSSNVYYSAAGGVYQERRLPKSMQFMAAALIVVIGFSGLYINQGLKSHKGQSSAVKISSETRLIAHNNIAPIPEKVALAAPAVAEADQISTAVQAVISKPPAAAWSIAIYDLKSQSWLYRNNSTDQMLSASLYKLYVVYGLSKKLPFDQWASTQVGGRSVQSCVDLMLRQSDNNCGIAIGTYVGWKSIDKAIHAVGYNNTSLNLAAGSVTSAEDTTRFMAELYQGKLFDGATTDFLKTSLKNQLYRSAIPAGCPGCTTYNKTGNESGVAHDTAIVESGGRTYAVTIMSEGGNYYKIASVERTIQSIISANTP